MFSRFQRPIRDRSSIVCSVTTVHTVLLLVSSASAFDVTSTVSVTLPIGSRHVDVQTGPDFPDFRHGAVINVLLATFMLVEQPGKCRAAEQRTGRQPRCYKSAFPKANFASPRPVLVRMAAA
jgi:hypothetical protein